MAKQQFNAGATVRIRVTFEDPDTAVETDPNSVTIKVRAPDGAVTTKVYNTDPEVIKEATGKYLYRLTLAQEGTYRWKWIGVATNETAVIVGQLDSVSEVDF
jgi:hypothetical protein